MSHGPASEGAATEPNLTPLLDVVMQLLMFFMMCVNFTQEQADQGIILPLAEAARPIDAGETDTLYINLRPYRAADWGNRSPEYIEKLRKTFRNEGDTMVFIFGIPDPMAPIDAKFALQQKFTTLKGQAERLTPQDPNVKTLIILRASEDLTCDQVYQMMDLAKVAGFRELRLRAKILQNPKSGGGGH